MLKKSKNLGKNISNHIEIQNISNQGIWILVHDKEYFMPFEEFPWFLQATIEQIYNVEFFHDHHLYWPKLDIDIDIECLKNPELFPLLFSTE